MRTICIDPGHGGRDSGATRHGILEKDIALEVSLKLAAYLESLNFKVILTRQADIFVDLTERANIANRADADLFISVHCNSHNSDAYGFETFHYPNAAGGRVLATNIQNQISSNKNLYQVNKANVNRGVKTARFTVLEKTAMEAVLVELAFISNYIDSQILVKNTDGFAKAITNAVLKYYNLRPIKSERIPVNDEKKPQIEDKHWGEYFYTEINKKALECDLEGLHEKRFDDYITRAEAMRIANLVLEIREYQNTK